MDTLLLLLRVALAAVFVLAGITKLLDLPGSRKAMADFGLPDPYAKYAGVALPLVEILIAILLVPRVTGWWGALAAFLLLAVFIGGMANVMRQGKAPDCHCFGQVHSEPVGWPTVARNGVLALLALVIVVQGPSDAGPGPIGWWSGLDDTVQVALALGLAAVVLFGLQGWVLFQLVRQNGRLLLRLDELEANAGRPLAGNTQNGQPMQHTGLPPGTTAPEFRLADLDGRLHTLTTLLARGKPLLMVFTDANCGPCAAIMPDIAAWQRDRVDDLTIALIARGDHDALREKTLPHGITHVLVQEDREVATAYNSLPTPSAVLVRPNGEVGSPPALGSEAIRALVATGGVAPQPPPAPVAIPVGEPAPDIELEDLDGTLHSLEEFRGGEVLLAFWNPTCGFCSRMLPELQAWESDRSAEAPQLVVVSRGEVDANRELGFSSTVLLDQGGSVMRQFGANGTPAGVLIDAEGRVASAVALGADAVFKLVRQPAETG